MSKKKSANALTAAVIIAVAGWALFLQKYMKEGSDSDNPANDLAAPSVIQEEDGKGQISAEELARFEREKEEALRMAKLQMEQQGWSSLGNLEQNIVKTRRLDVLEVFPSPTDFFFTSGKIVLFHPFPRTPKNSC